MVVDEKSEGVHAESLEECEGQLDDWGSKKDSLVPSGSLVMLASLQGPAGLR